VLGWGGGCDERKKEGVREKKSGKGRGNGTLNGSATFRSLFYIFVHEEIYFKES
jgi:hypothetical protein